MAGAEHSHAVADIWEVIKWALGPLGLTAGWIGKQKADARKAALEDRTADINEATLVLGKWKEMVEAHEHTLERMQNQLDASEERSRQRDHAQQLENDRLRDRIGVLERALEEKDKVIKGLQNQIIQQSRSAAVLLQATSQGVTPTMVETAKAMKRADEEAEPKVLMAPFSDEMFKLDEIEGTQE